MDKRESYELEIIHEDPKDGLTRPGMVNTKIIGVRDIDDVRELTFMFKNMASKMPGSRVAIGRKIAFYCHACHGLIGEKTIPLRVEQFRPFDYKIAAETRVSIHAEMYRCISCGHSTRYDIQDPLLSIY